MSQWLFGMHAVEGALQNDPDNVSQVWLSRDRRDTKTDKLLKLAERHAVKIARPPRGEFDQRFGNQTHQGAAAEYRSPPMLVEQDLPSLVHRDALFLVLDHIQDPRNFGACLRSAAAAGVDAVIFPKDRSASVSPLARKTASGATEHLRLVQVTNLASALRRLQQANVWLVGADGGSERSLYELELTGALAIVVGNEGDGLKHLTKKHCDYLVSIPMVKTVESLNVSVATGVFLFEAVRQRSMERAK